MIHTSMGKMTLFSALMGCVTESAPEELTQDEATYAEAIYADYAAASGVFGGRPAVRFDIRTTAAGALDELAGHSLENIVGLPSYQIKASDGALNISDVRFSALNTSEINLGDLALTVDGFNDVGLPVGEGRYRKLEVQVSVGVDTLQHDAVEFCWSSLGHCVVFDPTIEFLDSIVNGLRQRIAEGYAPQIHEEAGPKDGTAFSRCGMASNPAVTSRSTTWGAYNATYKNVYQIVMVSKNIGGQQSGLRCDVNCNPAPFGYSNSSNGWANFPFNIDCENKFAQGITGRTGKFEAETKCAHGLQFDVKADATIANQGSASVSINWNTVGSVDSNGGAFLDTCAFF